MTVTREDVLMALHDFRTVNTGLSSNVEQIIEQVLEDRLDQVDVDTKLKATNYIICGTLYTIERRMGFNGELC